MWLESRFAFRMSSSWLPSKANPEADIFPYASNSFVFWFSLARTSMVSTVFFSMSSVRSKMTIRAPFLSCGSVFFSSSAAAAVSSTRIFSRAAAMSSLVTKYSNESVPPVNGSKLLAYTTLRLPSDRAGRKNVEGPMFPRDPVNEDLASLSLATTSTTMVPGLAAVPPGTVTKFRVRNTSPSWVCRRVFPTIGKSLGPVLISVTRPRAAPPFPNRPVGVSLIVRSKLVETARSGTSRPPPVPRLAAPVSMTILRVLFFAFRIGLIWMVAVGRVM